MHNPKLEVIFVFAMALAVASLVWTTGIGVATIEDLDVVISMEDNASLLVEGTDGADGARGADGVDGADGADGARGADGVDGADGADGARGADGVDGADGRGSLIETFIP